MDGWMDERMDFKIFLQQWSVQKALQIVNGYYIILISPQGRQMTQKNVLALAAFVKSILYFKDFYFYIV